MPSAKDKAVKEDKEKEDKEEEEKTKDESEESEGESKSKGLQFFAVEDDSGEDSDADPDSVDGSEASGSDREYHLEEEKPEDNGISREDAELVLDEYRSARTIGLPPPNVMFAASKKPEFLKASTVASKWDGEKQLNNLRAERARKTANPDVISASAKLGDEGSEEIEVKRPKKS